MNKAKPKPNPTPVFAPNDWVRITSGAFYDCIGQVARVQIQPASPLPMYRVAWIACVDGKPAVRLYGGWHDESALELVDVEGLFEGADYAATVEMNQ